MSNPQSTNGSRATGFSLTERKICMRTDQIQNSWSSSTTLTEAETMVLLMVLVDRGERGEKVAEKQREKRRIKEKGERRKTGDRKRVEEKRGTEEKRQK